MKCDKGAAREQQSEISRVINFQILTRPYPTLLGLRSPEEAAIVDE